MAGSRAVDSAGKWHALEIVYPVAVEAAGLTLSAANGPMARSRSHGTERNRCFMNDIAASRGGVY